MSLKTAKVVLGAIVAVFILASVYVSILIVDRQVMLREVSRYNISWLASQAVAEFTRLEQRISAFGIPGGNVDKGEVELRFSVVLNRMELLQDGEFREFLARHPEQLSAVKEVNQLVASAQPLIDGLDQSGGALRALAYLAPAGRTLNGLSAAANRHAAERVVEEQQELLRLHSLFTAAAAGLIAGGVGLILLLGWHNALLDRARAALDGLARDLRTKTDLLETTLGTIDQGLIMADASNTVQVYNRRAPEILKLPDGFLDSNPSFDALKRLELDQGYKMTCVGELSAERPAEADSEARVFEQRQPDGTIVEIRSVTLPEGGAVHTYTDLTARRSAESAKNNFLSTMSHEIRTPLTGLLGMADLLAGEELSGRQHFYVDAITSSGQHLLAIVNDVLDFSRIEAGKVELDSLDFSMSAVINNVKSVMAPQALERGLKLEFSALDATVPTLKGDATRLSQVLINLISNGLKFTDMGGVDVYVSWTLNSDNRITFRFDVKDTGIGISEEERSRLFNAFAQVDSSPTRRFGGSGLGLVISQRLVQAMGGAIDLNSIPGVGSHFWFELSFEKGGPLPVSEAPRAEPARAEPLKVLVAEDVLLNRQLLGDMLSRRGHQVSFAENGLEAVELVAREPFDAVVMDVQMPILDGVEATRRIRQLEGPRSSVRIVGVTANVLSSERDRYLAAGMDAYVTKPIDWSHLFYALRPGVSERDDARRRTEPSVAETLPPCLDRQTIQHLSMQFAPEHLESLLADALHEAARSCKRIRTAGAAREQVMSDAHAVKGTSGLFGLARISALAGEIEAAAREGRDFAGALTDMDAAIDSTGADLCGSGAPWRCGQCDAQEAASSEEVHTRP